MIKRRLTSTALKPQPSATVLGSVVKAVLNSPGRPLDSATSGYMGSRFGHDFSKVRVHADSRAAEAAEAVNSYAFTFGTDIVFGPGQYSPQTKAGQGLLAHELTHVVQQQSGAAPLSIQKMAKWKPGAVDPKFNLAERFVSGNPHAGETFFTLNGTPFTPNTSAATAEKALDKPTFTSTPSADGKNVECTFNKLPTNVGSFTTKTIKAGKWQKDTTKKRMKELFPGLTPCEKAKGGDATLTIADNPAVTDNTKAHEGIHATDDETTFNRLVVPWDDQLTQGKKDKLTGSQPTDKECQAQMYATTPTDLIRLIFNDINTRATDFHGRPEGRDVIIYDPKPNDDCSAVRAKAR